MTFMPSQMMDNVTQGDCVEVMDDLAPGSVVLILTAPPYLVNYQDRSGRQVETMTPMHGLIRRSAKCSGC